MPEPIDAPYAARAAEPAPGAPRQLPRAQTCDVPHQKPHQVPHQFRFAPEIAQVLGVDPARAPAARVSLARLVATIERGHVRGATRADLDTSRLGATNPSGSTGGPTDDHAAYTAHDNKINNAAPAPIAAPTRAISAWRTRARRVISFRRRPPAFRAATRAARRHDLRRLRHRLFARLTGMLLVAFGVWVLTGCHTPRPETIGINTGDEPAPARPAAYDARGATDRSAGGFALDRLPLVPAGAAGAADHTTSGTDTSSTAVDSSASSNAANAPAPDAAGTDAAGEPRVTLTDLTPNPGTPRDSRVIAADARRAAGELAEARRLYSASLYAGVSAADEAHCINALTELSRTLLSGLGPAGDAQRYVVRKGDTLFAIAQRFGTSVGALKKLNGLGQRDRIIPRQELRVLRTHPRLVVLRGRNLVDLWLGDHFVKRYVVACGPLPEDTGALFVRGPRITGSPRPALVIGPRLVLHATLPSAALGRPTSTPGIALHQNDLAELMDIATTGTPVTIRP